MLPSVLIQLGLWFSGAALTGAAAVDMTKRQTTGGCLEIGRYFNLINTALFSVNYVRNTPHPCNLDLIPVFNARGLDGIFALELICIYDGGTNIFGNQSLTQVNDDMIVALIGLFDAAINDNGPSRNLSCANLDTDVLTQVGLPAARIKDIICGSGPCIVPGTDGNSTLSATSKVAPSTSAPSSSVTISSVSISNITSSMSITSMSASSSSVGVSSSSWSCNHTASHCWSQVSSSGLSSSIPTSSSTSLRGYDSYKR